MHNNDDNRAPLGDVDDVMSEVALTGQRAFVEMTRAHAIKLAEYAARSSSFAELDDNKQRLLLCRLERSPALALLATVFKDSDCFPPEARAAVRLIRNLRDDHLSLNAIAELLAAYEGLSLPANESAIPSRLLASAKSLLRDLDKIGLVERLPDGPGGTLRFRATPTLHEFMVETGVDLCTISYKFAKRLHPHLPSPARAVSPAVYALRGYDVLLRLTRRGRYLLALYARTMVKLGAPNADDAAAAAVGVNMKAFANTHAYYLLFCLFKESPSLREDALEANNLKRSYGQDALTGTALATLLAAGEDVYQPGELQTPTRRHVGRVSRDLAAAKAAGFVEYVPTKSKRNKPLAASPNLFKAMVEMGVDYCAIIVDEAARISQIRDASAS